VKRSVSVIFVLAIAIGLVVGGRNLGSASSEAQAGRTLRLSVQFSPFFLLDLGDKGLSMGDEIVAHDLLVDSTGKQVGHDGVSCIVTDPGAAEAECTATYDLPGGTITTQFLNAPPPVKHFAVTGGSGIYRNVRGQGVLTEHPDQTGTLTFDLIG
jgi:hypothetical protein